MKGDCLAVEVLAEAAGELDVALDHGQEALVGVDVLAVVPVVAPEPQPEGEADDGNQEDGGEVACLGQSLQAREKRGRLQKGRGLALPLGGCAWVTGCGLDESHVNLPPLGDAPPAGPPSLDADVDRRSPVKAPLVEAVNRREQSYPEKNRRQSWLSAPEGIATGLSRLFLLCPELEEGLSCPVDDVVAKRHAKASLLAHVLHEQASRLYQL